MRVPRHKYIRHTEQKLKRKNFFPTLLVTILLWLGTAGIVYFVDPGTFGATPLFFIVAFFTLLFTFSLLFADSRRGMVTTIASTLFLTLLYLGVGNVLNLILITAIVICIEMYYSFKF
ncbi:MAG: hypothetical protein HYV90_01350 [Candidatus Woesebacteria bacterium]|nr:MAG: hypothetical protein HYV90_01350 [Candidatus Woesebacteria bacterium]